MIPKGKGGATCIGTHQTLLLTSPQHQKKKPQELLQKPLSYCHVGTLDSPPTLLGSPHFPPHLCATYNNNPTSPSSSKSQQPNTQRVS